MAYSKWYIWLHPRRVQRLMDEQEGALEKMSQLQEKYGALESELASARGSVATLTATIEQLTRQAQQNDILQEERLLEAAGKLEAAEREVAAERERSEALRCDLSLAIKANEDLSSELADRKDAESQIAEFEGKLARFSAVKERYEARIGKLKAEVARLRKSMSMRDADADELWEIDMDSDTGMARRVRREYDSTADGSDDWLEQLHDNLNIGK